MPVVLKPHLMVAAILSLAVTLGLAVAASAAPVATPDSYSTSEDALLTVAAPGVLANDTGANQVTLVYSTSHGALTLNSDGSFTYQPDANYNGADNFTYDASDGVSTSQTTVFLNITAVNDAPVASDYSHSTTMNVPLTNSVATGVTDVDNSPGSLLYTLVTAPASGSVMMNANGSYTYTPDTNFVGADTFNYQVSDPGGLLDVGTVTIMVGNPQPVAGADTYALSAGTTLNVAAPGVLANDSDANNDPLTAVLGSTVGHGSLSLQANGSFSYTPNAGFYGTDSFTYSAHDGAAASAPVTVTLTVSAVANSITIRQTTDGPDGTFSFTSATPGLNLSVTTIGGTGGSAPVVLAPGSYRIEAAAVVGLALSSISCTGSSSTDLSARAATVTLGSGEAVICTFSSGGSQAKATEAVTDLVETRSTILVSEGIRTNARIDRLNKRSNKPAPGSVVMGFLPMLANGNVSGSASLAAIESATGQGEPSEFDIWIEGTFGLLHQASSNGRFALVSLGADYLVSPDILVGLSLRIDTISQVQDAGGTSGGTGWMAGPYLTARLTDNLYLDLDAMAGTADNHVSPFGTYTDDFSSYRWQLGAALQGHWEHGPWAFEPAVRFAYFEEVTDAYTDTPGAVVPSTRNGVAQLSFGPGVAYRFVMADHLDVTTNLKLAGTLDIGTAQPSADTFHARLEGGFGFALPGGAHAQVSSAHAGIGAKTASTSLSLKVSSGF